VSGRVVDASGATVKGAAVSLLNDETGVVLNTSSSADGTFILPPVSPGHYTAKVNATGFQPWQDQGIVIETGQVKAINATLTVGGLSQTVTVTDAPPELQVENADRSTLLEPVQVTNLPLDPRNPLQLIAATVGVTYNDSGTSGTNNTTESTTNQFRINGAKYATTDLLIDGGANMVAYNNQAAGIPGVDAVSEFRVLTTAYAPEYGYTSGGIVNISIKSGTDKFHGGLWEYYRGQEFDANGYNANAAGLAKPNLLRNQYGGQVGGPVIVPHFYNGHGKTFFFGSYEGLKDTYEPAGGFSAIVPTDAMAGRNGLPGGDFSVASNSANYPNISKITLYDPTNLVGGARVAFPNNIIPASRINPVGQKLLRLYPSPTPGYFAASNGAANYFSNATEGDTDNSYDLRIDHQFSPKHSIFGHLDRFSNKIFNPDDYGNNQEPTNSNDRIPGYHVLVQHTWTIKDNLIFTQHGSWGHSESNRASAEPLSPSGMFGFNAAAAPGVTDTFTPQVESVSNQIATIGNSEPYEVNHSTVYQYQADATYLKGRHEIKFGGDIRRYFVQHFDPVLLTLTGGSALTGGPTPSSSNTNGSAIAEILLGFTPVGSGYAPRVTLRDYVYFGYVEDTWKLRPKLTATYGLRYGVIGSWRTDGNILDYLDETSPSPVAAAAGLPNLVGGLGIPGVSISKRTEQDSSYNHWEPRIGLSYAVDDKTVIHAGFGLFRHPQAAEASYSELGGLARASTSVSSQTVGSAVQIVPGSSTSSPGYYSLGDPFYSGGGAPPAPYGDNPVAKAGNNVGSGPLSINLGQTAEGDLRKQIDPYQEIASLDIQRSLPEHFVVTAGYINNEGVRLRSAFQLNQLTDAQLATCLTADPTGKTCSPLSTAVANPFYNVITDPSSTLSAKTVPEAYLLRAFPQFSKFEPIDVGWGHSTYRALQITLQHRESNGLSVLIGYTLSKAIDQTTDSSSSATIQDNGCLPCERSISEQDSTHNFVANTIYTLPFGHNRMFLTQGIGARIASGIQIGEAYKYYTGIPVQLTQSATSNVGNAVLRPTVVPGVSIAPLSPTQAFNPAAFTATPAYKFGNAPRYSSNIRYPNYDNLDVFIQKVTPLDRERMSITVRFEALNATNAVVFGAPVANINSSSTFGNRSTSQTNGPRECQLSGRFTF
jgi:hypothetical protein